MSTHTADPAAPDHPFEPEWNPTPTNGELTAELGNPFREELQVDTALPCSTAIEDMVAAVEQQSQPKSDPLTDGYSVGGPGQIKATPAEAVTAPQGDTAAQESPKDSQAVSEPLSPSEDALPETFTEPVVVDVSVEEPEANPEVEAETPPSKGVDPVGKAKARAANGGGGRRLGQVKKT